MPRFTYDHMLIRSRNPEATAQYYREMFDAKILESSQSDGPIRIDLDTNGLTVLIGGVSPQDNIPSAPAEPYIGLEHFGLRVENMDEAVAELKRRGAEFSVEPHTYRPGVKVAFVRAPDNVRIELLERS